MKKDVENMMYCLRRYLEVTVPANMQEVHLQMWMKQVSQLVEKCAAWVEDEQEMERILLNHSKKSEES